MSKLIKSATLLMVITIISKILGFCRELFLASAYGTSIYADTYVIALNIPTVLFATIGSAITTSYIPIVTQIKKIESEEYSLDFTNNLINIILAICIVIAIIGSIYTEQLVKIFAIGFEGERLKLTISFTRILLVGIIFIGISNIMTGYLHTKSKFIIPGLIGVPYSLIIIISTIISSIKHNIYILIYGTLLAIIFQLIIQLPSAIKEGYRYKLKINFRDKYIKNMLWLVFPVVIGASVNQLNTIIDRTLASTLNTGTIAAFNYADRLYSFIQGLFVVSIISVVYPKLANLISKNDMKSFKISLKKAINTIILLITPISVGAIVLAHPIVKVLFQRGAFNSSSTIMTCNILIFYSIGIIAYALRDIVSRAFYSLQDTKTPMINGTIAIIFNIILNLILIRVMGYIGLAIASTISAYIGIVLLFINLNKKIGYFGQDKIIKTTIKSIMASLIMGAITLLVYKIIIAILGISTIGEIIALFSSIIVGCIIYILCITIFKVEEINEMKVILISKINSIK